MEKTVDLIVPCFNEGEVLELFHSEVSAVLDGCEGYAFHFIFVNDGSRAKRLISCVVLQRRISGCATFRFHAILARNPPCSRA